MDLAYSFQDNKTRIKTMCVVLQSNIQLQQKDTGTNI